MMKSQNRFIFVLTLFSMIFLTGCGRMPTSNFQHLELSKFPNYFLMCPQNYCNVTPSAQSPVFPVSADDLFNLFNEVVASENNINFVYSMPEQGQFGLTASSNFFQLPDDVDVQFIALSDTTSTLAVYSKSRYLIYDFGLNRWRIQKWMDDLAQRSKKAASLQAHP